MTEYFMFEIVYMLVFAHLWKNHDLKSLTHVILIGDNKIIYVLIPNFLRSVHKWQVFHAWKCTYATCMLLFARYRKKQDLQRVTSDILIGDNKIIYVLIPNFLRSVHKWQVFHTSKCAYGTCMLLFARERKNKDITNLRLCTYVPAVCVTMQVSYILWGVCGQVVVGHSCMEIIWSQRVDDDLSFTW